MSTTAPLAATTCRRRVATASWLAGAAMMLMLMVIDGASALAQTPTARDTTRPPLASDVAVDPHAVQPERPTVATHAWTVAPGWLEIESGVERDVVGRSTPSLAVPTELKIGLANHVQLSVFAPLSRPIGTALGVGDFAAGVKWRVLDDAPVLGRFAVLPSIKVPSGASASGRGTGTTDASVVVISSHDLGNAAMDLNVGYTRRSGDGASAPRTSMIWTASFGGSVTSILGWTTEVFGAPATGGPSGQPPIVAWLGGPTVLARPWLAFDVGVIVPIHGPQAHALYAGAVYNVGRLWQE